MRILLADDHALLREGLKQILSDEFPEAEFLEAGTTHETIACLEEHECDVVVLDVFMPGRSGLDVLSAIRQKKSRPAVLVLTSAPEEQLAIRVLRAGASGYLNKQTAPEHLVQAVRKILQGGKYVSATLAERLANEAGREVQLPHEKLSDREFQVMRLLVAGKSLKEIASELSLSAKTISTFHTRIWEKLGVKNDVEMVHYALEHRLADRPANPNSPGA
ncbi:MAG TPA: response regulator transcription factor [Patescibacteria group bacterium]|jgi:DNA-binding NarL/FixJ family response regulator|nr:response regulator transcription factor [Patescibacteria group bacterium]